MSDFAIRVRLAEENGTLGRVLKTSRIEVAHALNSPGTIRFTTSEKFGGAVSAPFVVALEYTSLSQPWEAPRDNLFIVEQDDSDSIDPTGTRTFQGIGYVPWLLGKLILESAPSAKNGKRKFTDDYPARPLRLMVVEGKARGWAPWVTLDWDYDFDSRGAAWTTADQETQEFPVGITAWKVLESATEDGLYDWWTEGTMLRVVRSALGTDRTEQVGLGGKGYNRAPVKSDASQIITDLLITGDKLKTPVRTSNPGATSRFGRLEASMTVSGVEKSTSAVRRAQPTLRDSRGVKREMSYVWVPRRHMRRPWVDFRIGDTLNARLRGDTYTPLRVIRIQVVQTGENAEASVTVGEKIRSKASKTARKADSGTTGSVVGGSGIIVPSSEGVPSTEPLAPTGLTVLSNLGYFHEDGTARSRVTLGWNPVTTATDGTEIDIATYEVHYKTPAAAGWRRTVTPDLTCEISEWESGLAREVKIRAMSVAGTWSAFSSTMAVTPARPLVVLTPPTAPIMSGGLMAVTANWNRALTTGTPLAGFSHVIAEAALSSSGPWVRVGGQFSRGAAYFTAKELAAAFGSPVIVGTTIWVRFIAVDTLGRLSNPSTSQSFTIAGITAPDLEANSVTANAIQAGAVEAQHFSARAQLPQGSASNRWPWLMANNAAQLTQVIANGAAVHPNENGYVTSSVNGIRLDVPAGAARAISGVTPRMPVPASRKLFWKASRWIHVNGGTVALQVRTWDAAGNHLTWNEGGTQGITTNSSGIIEFSPAAAEYGVIVTLSPPVSGLVTDAYVIALQLTEVIGNAQAVEIAPSGIRMFDTDGNLRIALGTATDDVIDVSKKSASGETVSVASVDENGNALFQSLDVSYDATFQGVPLIGTFASDPTNGEDLGELPLFDRMGRGIVATGDIGSDSWSSVTHTRAALASFTVNLVAGRLYQFAFIGNAVAQWEASGGSGQLSMDVHWSTSNHTIASPSTTGGGRSHARVLNTGAATGAAALTNYIPFREFSVDTTGDYNVLVSLDNPAGRAFSFFPGDYALNRPRVVLFDIGPASIWSLDMWASRGYLASGGSTGGSTTPPSSKKTIIRSATWSVLWGPSGSIRPSGGSMYDDGRMLQGGNSSGGYGRAARVGFPALGLSGRTIKGVWLRLKNRHTKLSTGAVIDIGTHGDSSAPSGSSPNNVNTFTAKFSKGQERWVPVPKVVGGVNLWNAIASGSIRGFQIGGPNVNSGASDYAIFDGYSTTNAATNDAVRPQLRITYQ